MLKVCLSGFESEEKTKITYYIQELSNIQIEKGINFQVNVLICNQVRSDKYKVAKILGIDVVTPAWIYSSYENKQLQDKKQYQLKCFRNINLALIGFNDKEFEKLQQFIIHNEGIVLRQITNADIVVLKKGFHLDSTLKESKQTFVDQDWISQCYKRNYYVPTQYYQINQPKVDIKLLTLDLINSKVQEALNKLTLSEYLYLKDTIIYIAIKDESLSRVLQQLVVVGDGFYLTQYLPSVTHIIYLHGHSEDISNHSSKIVHPMWLFDCFIYKKRVNEDDYSINLRQSEKTSIISSFQTSQEEFEKNRDNFLLGNIQNNNNINNNNNNENDANSSNRFGLRSISFGGGLNSMQQSTGQQFTLGYNRFSKSISKSNLFSQCYFYVLDHPSLNKDILSIITSHSGLYEKLGVPLKVKPASLQQQKSRTLTIFLFPDAEFCREIIELIEKTSKLQIKKYLNYRWVQYCVEKNILEFQIMKKELFHLLPISRSTPIPQLNNKLIYLTIKDPNQKIVLNSLAHILTGMQPQFDLPNLDYFISDHECKKQKQIDDINKKARVMNPIQIKDIKWLVSFVL